MTYFDILRSALFSAALALPVLPAMEQAALAQGAGQAVHINANGRNICRALARQSGSYWEVKVRGRFLDSYAGSNRFVVKTCFETRSECVNYAENIRHHIQGVETVNYARCNEK